MSSRGTYVEGRFVFLDDAHGWPFHLPTDRVAGLLDVAKNSDRARARYALRWFDRDALQGAVNLLNQADQCTHTDATGDCDEAAVFDLRDTRPRCDTHKREKD